MNWNGDGWRMNWVVHVFIYCRIRKIWFAHKLLYAALHIWYVYQVRLVQRFKPEMVCTASCSKYDVWLWWYPIHWYSIQWLVYVNRNWLQKFVRCDSTEFNWGKLFHFISSNKWSSNNGILGKCRHVKLSTFLKSKINNKTILIFDVV